MAFRLLAPKSTQNLDVIELSVTNLTVEGQTTFGVTADVASAASLDFSVLDGNITRVTGTTPTSSVTLNIGQVHQCIAVGAWPLVHHATNHPLPNNQNYTCSAGDLVRYTKDGNGDITTEIIPKVTTVVTYSWSAKSSGYTAVTGDYLLCDTSAGGFEVTLPATPSAKDYVWILDAARTFATYNLTVGRNGSNIMNTAADYTLNRKDTAIKFEYIDGTQGWKIVSYSYEPPAASSGTTESFVYQTLGVI